MTANSHGHEARLDELAAAWCARDLTRFLACFTPDAVYQDMARQMTFRGHEGLAQHAREAWAVLPDLSYRLLHRHATDEAGAAHWCVRGTPTAPGAAQDDAAPALAIQVEGLALYRFRGGRIGHMTHAWNLADWFKRPPSPIVEGTPAVGAPPEGSPEAHRHVTSDAGLRPTQAAFDLLHVDLDLEIDPERQHLRGCARLRLRALAPLSVIDLDLDERLAVQRAVLHGPDSGMACDAAFEHADRRVLVQCPVPRPAGSVMTVDIHYEGHPQASVNPPFDGGFTWARSADGQPWVGVSVQLRGASLWWPCKEHPSDKPDDGASLHFTVPAGLTVVSNGRLTGIDELANGRRRWHWQVTHPINSYNVTFNLGPFVELKADVRSVDGTPIPFSYFVLPEDRADGQRVLPELVDHLRFLEATFGPYPFRADKYAVVETPYIGMEHQTAIAYGRAFDARIMGFLWIALHEASHEWWGNMVSAGDWRDFWLQEGFAKYTEALYAGHLHGPAAYHEYMARLVRPRLASDLALAPSRPCTLEEIAFGFPPGTRARREPYDKGACVLHTLRWLLGDDAFMRLLRTHAYPDPMVTDGSRVRTESTDDFMQRAAAAFGRDLGWFTGVYLRQPVLPHLRVQRTDDALELRWEVPDGLAFPMPVDVQVNGQRQRCEVPDGGTRLPLSPGADVQVDPDWWVLRDEAPPVDHFGTLGLQAVSLNTAIAGQGT